MNPTSTAGLPIPLDGGHAASSTSMTSDRADNGGAGSARRSRRGRSPTASEQLEELLGYPWPFSGRPPKHDLSTWTVTDDRPDPVPVTEAEIEVFERWFGDRKSTRLNSSHSCATRMPSSA